MIANTLRIFFIIVTFVIVAASASAQCGYDGSYPNYGDVTPAGVGTPNELIDFVWGGEHYTINATAGCTYTVSMCGTSWDTQLTIFDASNTEVASNDDSCGLQSSVTFTAASTAAYTVQVNQFPCGTNSTDAEYFGVSLISCPATISCDDPTACNYDASTTGTADCCYDDCLTFIAGGGGFDGEISWTVTDGATTIASGVGNHPVGMDICLAEGCYTINYFDSWGDGWNGATFEVLNDGVSVFIGTMGSGASLSQQFCTEYVPPCFDSEPTGCPDIDAGDDISIPSCTDPCTPMDIEAEVFESGFSDSYRVCEIDYAPPYAYNAGTPFSVAVDDVWTDVITLPFNFCFFGVNYNQAIVGSNGLISFDTTDALGYCDYAFNDICPSTNLQPSAIFGAYHDIDPSVCGGASYAILGASPCRVFVVNYNNVCHFSCNAIMSTTQIVLYETTNAIEVYVQDKTTCPGWNSGNALIGIQDQAGTTGYVAPGRQTGPWSASNEAWRFTPDGAPNFEVEWFEDGASIGTGTTVSVCPGEASQDYLARATYTRCDGSTIQVEDQMTITCAAIMLPVEWLGFEAKLTESNSEVICSWITASEQDNDYFTVERTTDGNWEAIGTVQGSGTTQDERSYSFVDENPYFGVSYYRIKQTDFNGEYEYSHKDAVNREEPISFSAFPNPSNGKFRLLGADVGKLRVVDLRGREVPFTMDSDKELSLVNASAGCYFVELYSDAAEEAQRIRIVVE